MTLARVRVWILIAGAGLMAAIALFFVYGRQQWRQMGHDVPDGLGKSIQQSTEGFTYSESRGGHTVYTLHASKAVQYKSGGHAELHDVSITLFSAQGAPSNRIYGSDFDWDPVNGIARAVGAVQIDFQGGPGPTSAPGKAPPEEGETRSTVHVRTSGLVFNKQTGLASTTEKLEFRLAEAAGSAIGASFDSQTGVMILASQVAFNSSLGGSPLAVRAHHAQFDRDSRMLYLLADVTDYGDSHSSADETTVSFRSDGSAYRVEAQGNVVFSGSDGQKINTRKAHIDLGPKSEPEQATLSGGLLYVGDDAARQVHGSASSATLLFSPQPNIRHVQLRDAVSLVAVEKLPAPSGSAVANQAQATSRQIQGTTVDIDFAPGKDRRPMAEKILAAGGARINVHTIYARTPPQDLTVKGDQLFATLSDGSVITTLRGTGHTSLAEVTPSGAKQSSTGDNLLLSFAAPAPPVGKKGSQASASVPVPHPSAQLQSAVQQGNVTLTQQSAPAATRPGESSNSLTAVNSPTMAWADRAAYDASSQVVQLSGSPRLRSASGELSAGSMSLERTTGNADAQGGVKATYQQANGQHDVAFGGAGPVHVIADHAHLDHQTDLTRFYGAPGAQARLWQGSDAVAAAVLELSRLHGTLTAHGAKGDGVNAVFTSKVSAHGGTPAQASAPSVVRLQSRTLTYAQTEHKATFNGAVTAQTPNGVLHANTMDLYFTAAAGGKPPGTAAQQGNQVGNQVGSQVSRIVAHGAVALEQPGRKGTGEELNYTAEDGKFILTGTSAAPPRLSDQVRGTVTGAALIFNDRDDSVIVSGGASQAVTQTRVAK